MITAVNDLLAIITVHNISQQQEHPACKNNDLLIKKILWKN